MRNTWPRPDLPPPYSNWTFTWRNGRQLATAKTGAKTTKYEYNADGLRTRKTNADGTYADYYWVGSTLLAEVQYKANGAFTRTLMFLHDEKGTIVGVGVKNAGDARFTHYYYAKNLQGDVVAIYRSDYNSTSQTYYPTLVASYEYDPWGKMTSVKGSSGAILSLEAYPNHIAHVNPIRYRGYYYDNETGFYYLQSRYYDPAISRFINADSYGSTGQAFLGTNMFAYCNNNPVDRVDSTGNSWKKAEEFSKQADEKVKEYLTPSNEYGTVVGFASIGVASACAVAKRAISMAVRPSNIGIGSFTKQCASDLCNVSRFDTISSRAFSAAAYGVALMDVGIGIYDNVQNHAPVKKIVLDATVDAVVSGGSIWAAGAAGSAIGNAAGSVFPVAGNVIGAGAGFVIGAGLYALTDMIPIGGKTVRGWIKEWINGF